MKICLHNSLKDLQLIFWNRRNCTTVPFHLRKLQDFPCRQHIYKKYVKGVTSLYQFFTGIQFQVQLFCQNGIQDGKAVHHHRELFKVPPSPPLPPPPGYSAIALTAVIFMTRINSYWYTAGECKT